MRGRDACSPIFGFEMALDHYVSQVHLKKFYATDLGDRMYAIRKFDLGRYTCDAYSQCRIEDGSTNPYLQQPRIIEEFLQSVEPKYSSALEKARRMKLDPEAVFAIMGFAAYVSTCSPGGVRVNTKPLQGVLNATAELLDSQGKLPPAPPELGNRSLTQLLQDGDIFFKVDGKYPQSIGIRNIIRTISVWGNSVWDILINDDASTPFFTSDFPIAIEPSDRRGVVNRILPLAPNLAIRIYPDMEQRGKIDLGFPDLRVSLRNPKRQEIRDINRLIVQCAESVVYFSRDLSWIPAFVAKYQRFWIEAATLGFPVNESKLILSSMTIAERASCAMQKRRTSS